jgi:hypothetical protein
LKDDFGKSFFSLLLFSLTVMPFVIWLSPDTVPFKFLQFWHVRGSFSDWIVSALPLFVWGFALAGTVAVCTRNNWDTNLHAERIIGAGTAISIWAGVVEEISFRWLFVLSYVVLLKVSNFLFFGWLGFGIAEWLNGVIFIPVTNFLTVGFLEPFLYQPGGWAVGGAIIASNALFRNGHKYQGLFGFLNSWFCGMYFFWIMFTYGLLAAILVHFLYDLLIFTTHYIDAVIERAQGK